MNERTWCAGRCINCVAGKYSIQSATVCSDCTVSTGKYNTECSHCQANTFDSIPGGLFKKLGCTACAASKYSVGVGNEQCDDCVDTAGKWNPECSVCPPSTYGEQYSRNAASASLLHCFCQLIALWYRCISWRHISWRGVCRANGAV